MGGCQSCQDISGKSTVTMLKRYSDSSCYVELRFFELLFKFANQNKIKLPIPSTYTFCIENSFPIAFKCDENEIIQVGKISESQIQEDFKTFQKQNGSFPAAIAKLEIPNSHEDVCLPLMT